jgi:hypothetical protein
MVTAFDKSPDVVRLTLVVVAAVTDVAPADAAAEFVPLSDTVKVVKPLQPWLPDAVLAVLTVKASEEEIVAV